MSGANRQGGASGRRRSIAGALLVAVATLAACSSGGAGGADSLQLRTPPRVSGPRQSDADFEFLRRMVDHQEGVRQLAMAVVMSPVDSAVRAEAKEQLRKRGIEQRRMLALLSTLYGETTTAAYVQEDRALIDSVGRTSERTAVQRAFYRQLIVHHRETAATVDEFLPRLRHDSVRAIAARMSSDLRADLGRLQARLDEVPR